VLVQTLDIFPGTHKRPFADLKPEDDAFPHGQLLPGFKSPLIHVANLCGTAHAIHVRWTRALLARDHRFDRFHDLVLRHT
jgi:hypothetical protein